VKRYVLDTNLYIRADRDAEWAEEMGRFLSAFLPSIYLHAVVAQEMLAGALDARREKRIQESLIAPFERRRRLVTPRFGAWKRAGVVMGRLVQRGLMSPGGFAPPFVNDCLLAASCREDGLVLVTGNVDDFALIRHVEPIQVTEPWPS
jgi:predicted nucleic acid-binding protein